VSGNSADEVVAILFDGKGRLSGYEPAAQFASSDFNVFVNRVWNNQVEVIGLASTNALVTVNGQTTVRNGEWFRAILTVDNAAAAVQTNIVAMAVWYNAAPGQDLMAAATGKLYVARVAEFPGYDGRAAVTNDSRFAYKFDGYGRLCEVLNTGVSPQIREEYGYYADGRRAWKKVCAGAIKTRTHTFTYDRWNLIREGITDHVAATSSAREYVWGLDLAGQRSGVLAQDAAGIGGLLAIRVISGSATNVYLPIADHNGNIHRVLDATTKAVVADYAYSPFGALIGEWGTATDVCPFRFQSKYYDRETELLYFGLRYFHAASAKWISRDPLGERGGVNLTAFCDNDPLNRVDTLGGNSLGWGEALAESSVAQSGDPKDLLQFVTTPMPDEERMPINRLMAAGAKTEAEGSQN
jgi:RHS repeat-associated protein